MAKEDTVDKRLRGKKKLARIDLGLALLAVYLERGEHCSRRDIAAWCGCTQQWVKQTEEKAIRKIREALGE